MPKSGHLTKYNRCLKGGGSAEHFPYEKGQNACDSLAQKKALERRCNWLRYIKSCMGLKKIDKKDTQRPGPTSKVVWKEFLARKKKAVLHTAYN